MRHALLLAASVCGLSGSADAAWHEASSKHFIIYADQSPKELQKFAAKLEQFDLAVRALRKMGDPAVAPSARPTIFVVRDVSEVRRIAGARGSMLAGFYVARSSGSFAVVPEKTEGFGSDFTAETVFFHEYAHHLMYEQLSQAVPRWFSEGFAEFFSTARFERDGGILIGASPAHRSYGVFASDGISYADLLAGKYPAKMSAEEVESLYGRGWLLAHYLTFAPDRHGQLADYLSRLGRGESSETASATAFGDFHQLERDIKKYVARSKLSAVRVKSDTAAIGNIEIRQLRPGEAAIIPVRIRSKAGVTQKTASENLAQAKRISQEHPGDALVAIALAEASLDAGEHAGAIAASTLAIQLAPRSVEARLFRGRALIARTSGEGDWETDIRSAREEFLSANKIEPEHPEPLRSYYETFLKANEEPGKDAIAALHYAAVLAPADRGLRWMSAQQYLIDRDAANARRALSILAFDPHGGKTSEHARQVIEMIDGKNVEQALRLLQKGVAEDEESVGQAP